MFQSHGRYYSCDKCLYEGQYIPAGHTVVYDDLNAKISDDLFSTQLNKDHHFGTSLVSSLGFGIK